MRLLIGQPEAMPLKRVPVWQKGMPQSMHRAACSCNFFCSIWRWNSFQSLSRSWAERSAGSSRRYSRNPLGLPMSIFQVRCSSFQFSTATDPRSIPGIFLEGGHDCLLAAEAGELDPGYSGEHAFVVFGHNLHKFGQILRPRSKDVQGTWAFSVVGMALDQLADLVDLLFVLEFFETDHLFIAAAGEITRFVDDVSDAATHSRGEVAAGLAEDHDCAAGHIFAAVIAHGFHNSIHAGVADAKALARHPSDIRLAAGRAVEGDVAGDDIIFRGESGALRGKENDASAG